MKHVMLSFIFCHLFVCVQAQNEEKLIRDYYVGYEKKDWSRIVSQLAEGFTFTSPNGDDHITLDEYKKRCWPTSKFFKSIDFSKIVVNGNTAFAIYNITTTDNKTVRNVEYYTFSNGKIKTIECFFGTGIGFPGNTPNPK